MTREAVEELKGWMDEDPDVVDHLLWGFLNLNLAGAAREIFCNTGQSQGFEVWRKIHALIYAKTERRRDELYVKIHNPKAAAHAGEVSRSLEEWDTNQRIFRVNGIPLRDNCSAPCC